VATTPDEQAHFRSVIGHFATGVAVVTARGPAGPCGMTANAVCSLSLEPLLVLVCFDNTARTLPIVRDSGRFVVNILRREQHELALVFASKLLEQEKFGGTAYHELGDGLPVLADALAWVACEVQELVPAGDHTIGIGSVVGLGHKPEGEPLVWYRGEYRTIQPTSPHLGLAPQ
jgi:3-hydroxy-9,10-secoandrosta-1,3,5(10)-triene-9,17-dione monooxygenase reductase component